MNKALNQNANEGAPGPRQGRPGGPKGKGPGAAGLRAPARVPPMAEPARMRRRHWGVLFSFVLLVIAPLALFAAYLWIVADDRYSSTVGFTVRQEEGSSATDLLGGLAGLSGSSSSPDGDVLYEFIRSQQIVRQIDDQLDLRAYFGEYWQSDPLFALWPDASIESLHWYWERMVRVSYDQATGLTELRVLAFDPVTAQTIATAIVAESQSMVNALNEAARSDAISYADIELAQAEERLKQTRAALTEFRTRTQIVDLEADIQGRMGVMNNLQQQLAAELVAFDELSSTTNADDPRVTQAVRRIQVIRDRIAQERLNFATTEVLSTGEDYPTLIAEFEGLSVEREFAEETYRAALAARDSAQANANRQSRYLATYVAPTFAESSQYPERFILFGLASLFVVLGWGIAVLIYYSIRDKA